MPFQVVLAAPAQPKAPPLEAVALAGGRNHSPSDAAEKDSDGSKSNGNKVSGGGGGRAAQVLVAMGHSWQDVLAELKQRGEGGGSLQAAACALAWRAGGGEEGGAHGLSEEAEEEKQALLAIYGADAFTVKDNVWSVKVDSTVFSGALQGMHACIRILGMHAYMRTSGNLRTFSGITFCLWGFGCRWVQCISVCERGRKSETECKRLREISQRGRANREKKLGGASARALGLCLYMTCACPRLFLDDSFKWMRRCSRSLSFDPYGC